ncbi:MAG: hypothetical protein GY849_16855 [Deltaproteobacteria bacterium]|nr:hypothetical protein [Deltaproteobacteria bacterium]
MVNIEAHRSGSMTKMKQAVIALLTLIFLWGCAGPEKRKIPTVFYPTPPERPRLQFLHALSTEIDLGRKQSAFQEYLLGKPKTTKRIGKPYDIGSCKGKIYFVDRAYKKLLFLDLSEKRLDLVRDERLGTLVNPSGIFVTADDVKYVADMKRKQVLAFGSDNQFLRAYGGKDMFGKPVDVAVYGDRLYVCDMEKHQVLVLERGTGAPKGTIGGPGQGEGALYKPTHVIVDHKGYVYVNNAFNYKINTYDPKGAFVRSYGYHGDGLGAFARPKGLAIDKSGHLYVVDSAFENVQIFDSASGDLLLFFGGAGTGPGKMYLPSGIHIDYENVGYFKRYVDRDFKIEYLIYVANTFGRSKIGVYGFGKWVGPPLSGEKGGSTGQGQ